MKLLGSKGRKKIFSVPPPALPPLSSLYPKENVTLNTGKLQRYNYLSLAYY